MRKVLALRLLMLAIFLGVCSLSVFANPTFSVTANVRDVVIDSSKAIVTHAALGVMPVPEPTTLVLFGTGIATLIGKRIKRRFTNSSKSN